MNNERMSTVKEYFGSLYQKYGVDERSLGWSKNKQDIRFEQIFKYVNDKSISVLDVGCGFGDMYRYLNTCGKFLKVDYCGIDIMDSFIEEAAQKYREDDASFICCDLSGLPAHGKYDWVVECGLFGLNLFDTEPAMYEYIAESMKKAFTMAEKGISFNFLSDKVDYRTSSKDFHAKPEKILEIAYGLSRRVIIDNSVMPFEFCVTVWRDDKFSTDTTVFDIYYEEKKQ